MLSNTEVDCKEVGVSDILKRADTDEETQDDTVKLAIAEIENVTVLHAVIDTLCSDVIESNTLGECKEDEEIDDVILSLEELEGEGSVVVDIVF